MGPPVRASRPGYFAITVLIVMVYFRLVDRRNARPHAAGVAACSRALRGQFDVNNALFGAMCWEADNSRALALA